MQDALYGGRPGGSTTPEHVDYARQLLDKLGLTLALLLDLGFSLDDLAEMLP